MNRVQVWRRSGVGPLAWSLTLLVIGTMTSALFWLADKAPSTTQDGLRATSSVPSLQGMPQFALSSPNGQGNQVRIHVDGRDWDPAHFFDFDAHGQLVMNDRLLDKLVSLHARLTESEHKEAAMTALRAALERGLAPAQAREALSLVKAYSAYDEAVQAHMLKQRAPANMDDIMADSQQRAELQALIFGHEPAKLLFAKRNEQAQVLAKAALIAADTSIPLAARKTQIATLRMHLPAEMRSAITDVQ